MLEIHAYNPEVWDGPWVGAATFCDRLLIEDQGFHSVIRMVDVVTANLVRPAEPGSPPSAKIALTLFIMFRSGIKPSVAELRVRRNVPDGTAGTTPFQAVEFPGEGMSVPIRIGFNLDFTIPGRYWFDVMLDDLIATRVPLLVVLNQLPGQAESNEG